MNKVAWKLTATSRCSINHYTDNGKVTLCNKKIPENAYRYEDAFGNKDCEKCLKEKEKIELSSKKVVDKVECFKKMVADNDGEYIFEDGLHKAWWDACGDKKGLYIVYGQLIQLTSHKDTFWITNNWLYLEFK